MTKMSHFFSGGLTLGGPTQTKKQHDVLVDVIQYLDSTKQSNTLIRSQVDTILNFEKKLKEDSNKELNTR